MYIALILREYISNRRISVLKINFIITKVFKENSYEVKILN